MKERLQAKPSKKRKSQEHFFLKNKLIIPNTEQLKYLPPKKNNNRNSLSVIDTNNHKEYKRRVNSLEINPDEPAHAETTKNNQNYPSQNNKNNNHCLSDRNINILRDPQKLLKYRKFSSNAELHQEELSSSVALKHKLSVIELQKEPANPIEPKPECYNLMVWIILIRKYFSKQQKIKANPNPTLPTLLHYLNKLQKSQIDSVKFSIERTPLESQLNKHQIINLLQLHHKNSSKSLKKQKDFPPKINYIDILNCLVQHQLKITNQNPHNSNSKNKEGNLDQHEEAVETARFQEGNEENKKNKKFIEVPYFNRPNHDKNSPAQSQNHSLSQNQKKTEIYKEVTPTTNKNKQSLNPSLSPFSIADSRSFSNSRMSLHPYDSDPSLFKKNHLLANCSVQSSLGMLTLQGKSPRELMQSQIYESMQRLGVNGHKRNNVSFSLEHLELEPHLHFEQTVNSFEEVLRKIKKLQNNYQEQLNPHPDQKEEEEHNGQEVHLFLQQLINYRMTLDSENVNNEHYSYFVSWEDLQEFKEHNFKLMHILLQSSYMHDFLLALTGVKIYNSPSLFHNIKPLLHPAIKIINISKNNISSLQEAFKDMPDNNSLEVLNISQNFCTDLAPALKKFNKIKEIHAQDNCIPAIQGTFPQINIKIIDLSFNKIKQQSDLSGVVSMKSLEILNLLGNPLLSLKTWKSSWKKSFSLDIVYQMDNLYVMSSYGHQKDIAFNKTPPKSAKANCKQNLDKINQQTNKSLLKLQSAERCKQQKQLPKQKISKIKTYIDGRLI